MHKSQVFLYLLSAFILGVFLSSFWPMTGNIISILVIIGIGIIAIFGFKNKFGLLAGFLILVFALGGARFSAKGGSLPGGNFNFVGQDVSLVGYVDSEPEVEGTNQRFVLNTTSELILITVGSYPRYKFGDFIEAKGELKLPENFGDFDYVTYLKKDGISTILFFPRIEIYSGELKLNIWQNIRLSLYKNIFVLKNKFQNAINLSVSEPNAAFINGILLGTRQNIPNDLKDAFSKTGTTHILAISGYNIMIISEAVLLGLILFFRRRIAFWISVATIIAFVILTGASASVVRAAVMGLLLSFAHGYGRLYDQKNSIVLAGAAMIWANPFVLVFDIGFQLSFAAVLGLIYLYPWLDHKVYKISELGGMKELTLMTISAQVAVAPLLIYYFGGFSPISLPANILILPFIPASMLLGFITGLAGIVSIPLGQIIGYSAWAVTTYQIEIVKSLSQ